MFSWNNVDPESQTVAQQHISIGSMYIVLSGVSGAGMEKHHRIVTGIQQSENTVQSPNAVSMSVQRRRLWINIEIALGECHVFAQSIGERGASCHGGMLSQCTLLRSQ